MDPLIQEAIRNPTSEQASSVMTDITPDILKDTMPSILQNMDSGVPSEELAETTVDGILTTVENTVLGDALDLVYDKFGERIMDLVFNGVFLKMFEKMTLLFS